MAERGRREEEITLDTIVNSAINMGMDAIVKLHPRFADQKRFIANYLDREKINDYVRDYITHNLGNKNTLDAKDIKDITKTFAGYVVSGELLDEKGKELILRESLKKESGKVFRGSLAREILKGEKYLDDTLVSFKDLYNLFQSGDYAKRMPELANAVLEVYDMGFADSVANVLYENGSMNLGKYRLFKKIITERAREGAKYAQKAFDEYIIPKKVAAIGFVGVGIASLIVNNSITGNVIGATDPNISGLLGGLLLVISGILLWAKNSKKKTPTNKKRRKKPKRKKKI